MSYKNKTKFIDLETETVIETDPWHIKNEYIKKINEHINNLKNVCGKNKIDYVQLQTDKPLDIALTSYLRKRTNLH